LNSATHFNLADRPAWPVHRSRLCYQAELGSIHGSRGCWREGCWCLRPNRRRSNLSTVYSLLYSRI